MEGEDFDPGCWKGHDFKEAKAAYVAHAGRSYDEARKQGTTLEDRLEPTVSTRCSKPLIMVCDQTGSMGEWPGTFFSKAGYLDIEGGAYLGEDREFCFAAVGDARNREHYPLQIRPFARRLEIKQRLTEIIVEKLGGGQTRETYELAALYLARNFAFREGTKPIIIFIADESPYDWIDPAMAKRYCRVNLTENMATRDAFRELSTKCGVYLIRKPYAEGDRIVPATSHRVHNDWAELIGEDHIAVLDDVGRALDVTFGILANETDKIDYFYEELKERQTPSQVKTVTAALKAIHAKHFGQVDARSDKKKPGGGKSILLGASGGKKTKSLLDD